MPLDYRQRFLNIIRSRSRCLYATLAAIAVTLSWTIPARTMANLSEMGLILSRSIKYPTELEYEPDSCKVKFILSQIITCREEVR